MNGKIHMKYVQMRFNALDGYAQGLEQRIEELEAEKVEFVESAKQQINFLNEENDEYVKHLYKRIEMLVAKNGDYAERIKTVEEENLKLKEEMKGKQPEKHINIFDLSSDEEHGPSKMSMPPASMFNVSQSSAYSRQETILCPLVNNHSSPPFQIRLQNRLNFSDVETDDEEEPARGRPFSPSDDDEHFHFEEEPDEHVDNLLTEMGELTIGGMNGVFKFGADSDNGVGTSTYIGENSQDMFGNNGFDDIPIMAKNVKATRPQLQQTREEMFRHLNMMLPLNYNRR